MQYLKLEDDYIPWEAAFMSLKFVYKRLLNNPEDVALMKSFVLDILEERYKFLGFIPQTNEDHLTTLGMWTTFS